jgi:hypothetical protein
VLDQGYSPIRRAASLAGVSPGVSRTSADEGLSTAAPSTMIVMPTAKNLTTAHERARR